MKKVILRFALFCISAIFLFSSSIYVSATQYVENVVVEDFSLNSTDFLPPGDIDANGISNASDLSLLRQQMLESKQNTRCSDVNGDGYFDARDLVRLKKNSVQIINFIDSGTMLLNGKTIYNGDILSKLGSGASYQISCTYKSETPITIKINGLTDEIVCVADTSENITSYTYTFKTPLNLLNISDVSVCIIGTGNIEDFKITRINMDNELVENW